MECLKEDVKKKYTFCTYKDRAILIATYAKMLDTKYEFYGFNDDLTDTIN